ncbi:hypothetical protein EON78_00875, partial [bacterium]
MSEEKWNYIIGDIHGCFDELLELEEKIKFHAQKYSSQPFIIGCGDLVDKGPSSKQVLEHFMTGQENGTHISVIGNHEIMMLQAFDSYSSKGLPNKFPILFETYEDVYN